MTYLCALHVHQCCVIYLRMIDGTLNTANDNIDNIRRDLQQSLNDISGWCCRNRMALNPNKTEAPETTDPPEPKLRDHANGAGFKASPTWSNCRRAAKVAKRY